MPLQQNILSGFTKSIYNSIFDTIAPKHCEICRDRIAQGADFSYICTKCIDSMPLAPQPDELHAELLLNFPADEIALTKIFSLMYLKEDFDYMQIIHTMKYRKLHDIGKELGKLLGKLISTVESTDYSAIIPVPIHKVKQRERGFNQSDFIAEGVSKALNIPFDKQILKRVRYTQTQTALDASQRKKNVTGAFRKASKKVDVAGRAFLLIDDVLTTGSTINACAEALLEMGARRVDGATLARA